MATVNVEFAQITHRELRNNSGEVLRRVAAGEVIEVTNHGEVVAVLTPPAMTAIERLRLSGRTRRPTTAWSDPWVAQPVELDMSSAEVLADLRGDR